MPDDRKRRATYSLVAFSVLGLMGGLVLTRIVVARRNGQSEEAVGDLLTQTAVIVLVSVALYVLSVLFARGAANRNKSISARAGVSGVIYVSRQGATMLGMRTLASRNTDFPGRLPLFFSVAIEEGGIVFWEGSSRNPRLVASFPWALVVGVRAAMVRQEMITMPGIEIDVLSTNESKDVVTLPLVLRGSLGAMGWSSSDRADAFAVMAENAKSDATPEP